MSATATYQRLNSGSNPAVIVGLAAAAASLIVTNQALTLADGLLFSFIWWGAFSGPIKTVMASLLSYQWMQASAKLWVANLLSVSLSEPSSTQITDDIQFQVGQHTADAIVLAFAAIAAISLGLRLLAPNEQVRGADFTSLAPEKLGLLYLPLVFLSKVAGPLVGGGVAQLLVAVGALRFLPVVLLVGIWFYSRRGALVLAAVCGTEVLLGLLGFFSDWKDVLIIAGISLVSLARHAWRRFVPLLAGGLVTLVALGTIWTMIKPNYRESLNGGTGQQVVLLSQGEQIQALSNAFTSVKLEDLSSGFLNLLDRISYVDYLADALDTVPARIEYQNGALWGEAIDNVVRPRFIFPNKGVLPSDSERTMRYTGRVMASGQQGTSISIGYVGDSYIDYGTFGAILIPFLLGIGGSIGTRALVALSRKRDPAIALPLALCFLSPLQLFETSNVKLLGALGWSWLACLLFALAWPSLKPLLVTRAQNSRADLPLTASSRIGSAKN